MVQCHLLSYMVTHPQGELGNMVQESLLVLPPTSQGISSRPDVTGQHLRVEPCLRIRLLPVWPAGPRGPWNPGVSLSLEISYEAHGVHTAPGTQLPSFCGGRAWSPFTMLPLTATFTKCETARGA